MASLEDRVKAAWNARFGVGKVPEALVRACAEKTAGMDDWQADLEIDSLVDAHVRRYLADRITGLGSYLEKGLKALDCRLGQLEGPDGVDSIDKGMRLADRLDLKVGTRLARIQELLDQSLKAGTGQKPELPAFRELAAAQAKIERTLEKQGSMLEKALAIAGEKGEKEVLAREWNPAIVAVVSAGIGLIAGLVAGGLGMSAIMGGTCIW